MFTLFTIIDTISVSREFKCLSKQIIRSLNNHSLGLFAARLLSVSWEAAPPAMHTLQQK